MQRLKSALQGKNTPAKAPPRAKVAGWNIHSGSGPSTEGDSATSPSTQFTLVLSDKESIQKCHSPSPLKVLKHTPRGATYTTISEVVFRSSHQDESGNSTLSITLTSDKGEEWVTSMAIQGDRILVPAQQEQLAELVVAVCETPAGEGGPPPESPGSGSLKLSLMEDDHEGRTCAAPFCTAGGLVRPQSQIRSENEPAFEPKAGGSESESELSKDLKNLSIDTKPADLLPCLVSYTANEHLWVGDNIPPPPAIVTDMLLSLATDETILISNTCHAADTNHKSILLPDTLLWWTDETTEAVPARQHAKPANWGGLQDLWRNHKNLRESKRRGKLEATSPGSLHGTEPAPEMHTSIVTFARSVEPDPNAVNPLRLVHVPTGEVHVTGTLEEKQHYAVISYTWSQFGKEELLSWSRSRAAKLGYSYIWIDQFCIDQGNKAEKNAEIKRMRDYYKSAAQVLVLLPDVTGSVGFDVVSADQMICVDAALNTSTAVLKEILACGWLKRVWTFQEAWVARQCVLCTAGQMLDGTVMDALLGMRKYEAVARPRVMCVGSKAIGNAAVANPNTVVWEGSLRHRQTVVGSTERWMLLSWPSEFEPPRLTLVQAWEASRGRDTVNEEDRVYALLSSVEGGDRVPVNRGRSLQEVIQDCVEAGIVGADLLAGSSPSSEADRSWMPDLTGMGPQHPLRVSGAGEIQQPLVWEGGKVSVRGKYFHFADVTAWFRIAEMKIENVRQRSEMSDDHWMEYAAAERQNAWTTTDVVGNDFLLVQPMPGSTQTVLVSGKKQADGSLQRKKGHVVWLKETGVEWLKDSEKILLG
ncbi:heterokaryon incompatibility protein-domain-containing protein [Aspergillus karnatakaensis]|uniref:HET domain protein n=1 Tax=Aspergillus karnatakaensis TaxID=1810916 RepID=UPI003CCD16A8